MKNPDDARARRSRMKILEATHAVMIESGLPAVNVKSVAERAGVQRSTVYNHWHGPVDLIIAAIDHSAGRAHEDSKHDNPPDDDRDDPYAALRLVVRSIGNHLGRDWGVIAANLAAAAEHDEQLADAHRRFVRGSRDDLASTLRDLIAAGHLRRDLDPQWVVQVLVAPLYYERLVMHRALDQDEIEAHLDATISLLTRPD